MPSEVIDLTKYDVRLMMECVGNGEMHRIVCDTIESCKELADNMKKDGYQCYLRSIIYGW